jgi:DNA repair exonuclease SbcCD nuclease subunit
MFFSDLHIGLHIGGYDFYEDHKMVLRKIERDSHNGFDLIVIGGDIFHSAKPTPRDYRVVIEFLESLTVPTLIIHGNHDEDGRGRFNALDPIATFYSTRCRDDDVLNFSCEEKICVVERPCIVEYEDRRFLMLGYLSDVRANRLFGCDAQEVISAVILDGIKTRVDVAFGHLDIDGAEIGNLYFMRGGKLVFSNICRCTFPILNGHIHKHQRIKSNVYISGSVVPTNIGDVDTKKYLTLEI